jgi:HPt (histidine-containing phosphotransfer) domain-containing protein
MQTHVQLINYDFIQQLIQDLGGWDATFFASFIDSLEHDTTRSLSAIESGLSDVDVDTISQAAHQLKGSCANLGAVRAQELCQTLEDEAHEMNQDDLVQMTAQLRDVCAQSLVALRAYQPE